MAIASVRDYKEQINKDYPGLLDKLQQYYYSHPLAVLLAPLYPEHSRNNIWILKKKL